MEKSDIVKEKGWQTFQETGLLWFVNSILHLFGWAICIEYDDETQEIKKFSRQG